VNAAPLLDETHDAALRSWVSAAASDAADFPIQNLPLGRFANCADPQPRLGVAIGDGVLDLRAAVNAGLLQALPAATQAACAGAWLNDLMARPAHEVVALRRSLSALLALGSRERQRTEACVLRRSDVRLLMPVDVRNYTDFYTSIHHARNTGRQLRPQNPLLPNFHHLPVGYHGRASTVCVSGTPLYRPHGQALREGSELPTFGPTQALDYECELGVYVGRGNALGQPVSLGHAPDAVFGVCLLNDWSARDIQRFEAQPLGPFLGKSFLTSVSPWVVTLEALAPFRIPAAAREPQAAPLSSYLHTPADRNFGGLDIRFQVTLSSRAMRDAGRAPCLIGSPQFRDQYWTIFQMLTHHCSNGCALLPGDLLGSGTVSGPSDEELGCLLELLQGGQRTITLPGGETRGYLQDGDELRITASCVAEGRASIGFGACVGCVMPAL